MTRNSRVAAPAVRVLPVLRLRCRLLLLISSSGDRWAPSLPSEIPLGYLTLWLQMSCWKLQKINFYQSSPQNSRLNFQMAAG